MKNFYFWLLLFWISSSLQKGYAEQFGDFIYSQDGTNVTITGYMGTNDNVVVPDFIEGLPVTAIGDATFLENSLTHIKLPQNLTFIGSGSFAFCYNLAEVSIPNSVKEIYSHAFHSCLNLRRVCLPEGLTDIKFLAFYYCESLETITIPSTVTNMEGYVFCCCYALTDVYFKGDAPTNDYFLGSNHYIDDPFYLSPASLYHLPGTKGWDVKLYAEGIDERPNNLWVQSPTLQVTGNNLTLSWPQGVLLETTNVITGPWITNSAPSPLSIPLDSAVPNKFYRVVYTQ